MNTSIVDKVIEQLKFLPQELQWRVLEFTRTLAVSNSHGIAGTQLLRFASTISMSDLNTIRETIERGCEQYESS